MAIDAHDDGAGADAAARLKEATEALEAVVRDRGLLRALSLEERTRLLTAAGDVFNPDVVQRRRLNKTARREEKAAEHPAVDRADELPLADGRLRGPSVDPGGLLRPVRVIAHLK